MRTKMWYLCAYSVRLLILKRDEICNQSIAINLSIVIGNRYQSITTRIFAIDWSSIININRLIDIDWYWLISIAIDYRFHRLDTPGLLPYEIPPEEKNTSQL